MSGSPSPENLRIEHAALRAEVIARIQLEYQVLTLTAVLVAALLSAGLATAQPVAVASFPIIGVFLSWALGFNSVRIAELGARLAIVEHLLGLRWEATHRRNRTGLTTWQRRLFFSGLRHWKWLLVSLEVGMVLLSWMVLGMDAGHITVTVFAACATLISWWILNVADSAWPQLNPLKDEILVLPVPPAKSPGVTGSSLRRSVHR